MWGHIGIIVWPKMEGFLPNVDLNCFTVSFFQRGVSQNGKFCVNKAELQLFMNVLIRVFSKYLSPAKDFLMVESLEPMSFMVFFAFLIVLHCFQEKVVSLCLSLWTDQGEPFLLCSL